MEVQDKVKKFNQELKENKKLKPFNIWAFIFSSFYFWYIECPWLFSLFLFLPFLLTLPLMFVVYINWAFLIAFLISHTIAGFLANKKYRAYQQNFVEKFKDADSSRPVEYYAVSSVRMFLLSLLSLGIYNIYWGFRQWKAYQETTKDDVNPYLCGFFINFTAPLLCFKMNKTLKKGKFLPACGIAYFLAYVGILILNATDVTNPALYGIMALIWIVCYLIIMTVLLPVQRAVNKYTTEVLKKERDKKAYFGEVVLTLLGFLMLVLNILAVSVESRQNPEPSEKDWEAIGFIYRHTKVYESVCAKEGYVLKKYPQEFKAYFAQDIDNLQKNLAQKGYTIEELFSYITPELNKWTEQSVYEELAELRDVWLIMAIAQEQGIPTDQVKLTEEEKALLPLKDVCEIFDDEGIELIKAGSANNFFKNSAM